MDLEEASIDLYHVLKSCKEGYCGNCPRKDSFTGSSNYGCKKQLLQDCFDFFDQYIPED